MGWGRSSGSMKRLRQMQRRGGLSCRARSLPHPQSGALTVYNHIGSSIKSRDQRKAREVLPNDKRINLHVFSVDFRQNGRLLLHQLVRPKPALQLREYGVVLSAIAADLRLVD